MKFLAKLVLSGLGTGYLRPAPGTWGSLGACAVFLAVGFASHGEAVWLNTGALLIVVLASIGCVKFGRHAEELYGKKDPSTCTADEWAGQSLALLFLPMKEVWNYVLLAQPAADGHSHIVCTAMPAGITWRSLLLATGVAFVAFRVFDIVKPPPCRRLEKLPHGWGVLLDDLAAGVYANIVCQLILRLGMHYS